MKFFAYILLAAIFLTILLNPFIELLSEFNDKSRIGTAVKVSCRNAVFVSADENVLRDVEAKINEDKFVRNFIDNFCISLNLSKKSNADAFKLVSNDGKYNDFEVAVDWIDTKECEIEVKTAYKFKTAIFKRFFSETAETNPTYIVLKRRQILNVEN